MASHPTRLQRSTRYWLVACVGFIGCEAQAAKWAIQPRLTVTETWSDNIRQVDTSEEHDFVTQVAPGVSMVKEGGRVSVNLDYQLGLVHYARDSESTRFDNRLQANGNAEILEQRFFVDFGSTAGQANTSSSGRRATDTISASGNREDFLTYTFSPYLVHHFGSYADGELRYRRAEVFNSGDSLDTSSDDFSFNLVSGRRFNDLPWTVEAAYQSDDNDSGSRSIRRFIDASVTYAFNRRYSVRLNGGYENNDLVSSRDDGSSATWRVTGIWTPSARTRVEFGYGKRFFGNTYSLDVSHRMRRAIFTARYFEDSTNSARRQQERQIFATEDAFGEPIVDAGLQDQRIPLDDPTISDDDFTTKRFQGGMALNLKRSSVNVNFYHERRSSDLPSNNETVFGVDTLLSHRLRRGTTAVFRHSYQASDFRSEGVDETYWEIDLSLTHQINRDWSGTVAISHRENDSDNSIDDFKENRVNASVNVVF